MSNMCKTNSVRYPDSKQAGHGHKLKRKPVNGGHWIILLVALLTACSQAVDPKVDRSFITDDPCAAPCWYGLKLDESTTSDVLTTLATLEFVNPNFVRQFETSWTGRDKAQAVGFGCLHPTNNNCGEAIFVDDKLKSLWVAVGYELTLGEVVNKLGEADYVEFGLYHPEVGGCTVDFFWPTSGIIVGFLDTRSETICQGLRSGQPITPDLSITSIVYVAQVDSATTPSACCTRIDWPGLADP